MDSGLSEYKAALDALFARTGSTAKFGLERTLRFLRMIGDPQSRFPSFHVAGTNGKGSTVATLSALLEAKGHMVGRYMSPHLIDFRERIVVGAKPVPEQYVVEFLDRWAPAAEGIGATFFEITTAMAYLYFAEREVDVAVIETGLGGRLDSTNVIESLVTGITSIGLDHQEYLGNTEAEIAREKAGIIREERPCVIGPLSAEARKAVYDVARIKRSSVIEAEKSYRVSGVRVTLDGTEFIIEKSGVSCAMRTGLAGSAQAANAGVALAMLDAAGPEWSTSLEQAAGVLPHVKLAGRFQRIRNMILDVAHNPDGVRSVVDTIEALGHEERIIAVLGVLADKDWRGMMTELFRVASKIVLVSPPSAPANRAWNPHLALEFASSSGIDAVIQPDFDRAIREASAFRGTVIVIGSFHTVGDALLALGETTL